MYPKLIQNQLFKMSKVEGGALEGISPKVDARLNKATMALRDAFPEINQGMDYPYASGACWSTMDLVAHLLVFTGPAHLTACTWSVSEPCALKINEYQETGAIISTSFLVDWRVQIRTPSFLAVAKHKFADVRVSGCHAKAFVLHNDTWTVSCVGSANFTGNPRIEAGHISTNKAVGEFHRGWIQAEIDNAKPFGLDMKRAKRPTNKNWEDNKKG